MDREYEYTGRVYSVSGGWKRKEGDLNSYIDDRYTEREIYGWLDTLIEGETRQREKMSEITQ
jgi:hypothetical protein